MEHPTFKTLKFKRLKEIWYKKLKDSGFNDIENTDLPDPDLEKCDVQRFNIVSPQEYETRTKYYSNARTLLHNYEFKTSTHRTIWEMHSEGMSERQIEKAIKGVCKKSMVHNVVNEIRSKGMPK